MQVGTPGLGVPKGLTISWFCPVSILLEFSDLIYPGMRLKVTLRPSDIFTFPGSLSLSWASLLSF